jgi:2'-5' RNA ligase
MSMKINFIKEMVRAGLLNEGKFIKEYSCVMLMLKYNKDDWSSMQKLIDDKDIYKSTKTETFGRGKKPHVTILYGLHEEVSNDEIKKYVGRINKPSLTAKRVSLFENEKFDVIKFDVVSEDLNKLNKMFKELPHTDTYPKYHPHITIAYCNKGVGAKYVDDLNEYFKENEIKFTSDKILFSTPDGNEKYYNFK